MIISKTEQMRNAYKAKLLDLDVFDINAWWDPYKTDCFLPVSDFDKWNNNIKDFGIDSAVVTHIDSVKYGAEYGNAKLTPLLESRENLYGCMVLAPEICFDLDAEKYIDTLLKQQFVCARMFPKSYYHSMSDYAVGKLLAILDERRVPLMLWHSEMSWETIDSICSRYPNLPVIVEGHNVKVLYHVRNYIPLLQSHKNFYMETHNLVLFDELKNITDNFGASKLIYGSYYPYNTPNHSLFNVISSRIDKHDIKAVLGANLRNLISQIVK